MRLERTHQGSPQVSVVRCGKASDIPSPVLWLAKGRISLYQQGALSKLHQPRNSTSLRSKDVAVRFPWFSGSSAVSNIIQAPRNIALTDHEGEFSPPCTTTPRPPPSGAVLRVLLRPQPSTNHCDSRRIQAVQTDLSQCALERASP
jgi:hypothetical protein